MFSKYFTDKTADIRSRFCH